MVTRTDVRAAKGACEKTRTIKRVDTDTSTYTAVQLGEIITGGNVLPTTCQKIVAIGT